MTGESRKSAAPLKARSDGGPLKTDGSVEGAELKPLKRPVSSDGFLIDRPLSPEEEGLAGPLPAAEKDDGDGK